MRPLVVLGLAAVAAGCSLQPAEPPSPHTAPAVPPVAELSEDVGALTNAKLPRLAANSAERKARKLTVRIRNVSCVGVGTGSGFAMDGDTLFTNRHVLAGADELEVATWDGRTLRVRSARVGILGDIAVAVVDGKLPRAGSFGAPPRAGAPIAVVGYPSGGPLTISAGKVLDRIDGTGFGVPGEIIRLTARVVPGNSGGPVLNQAGRVVAVVYAREIATGHGLAIPVDTLKRLIRTGGFEPVPPCGSE